MLRVEKLTRTYTNAEKALTVLHSVSFDIKAGSACAITGASGSGKTTLLGLCAGLDRPTSGSVLLNGQPLHQLSEDELAAFRNRHIGFVFQSFQLIPTLTALENVMVPLELRGEAYREVAEKAESLLTDVGLRDRMHHYPAQLSGGEQQRVGIARAFIHNPDVLFADEPTGNLDAVTSEQIEDLLFDLNARLGTTLIIVTHDPELAVRCDRAIQLRGGEVVADTGPVSNVQQTETQPLEESH